MMRVRMGLFCLLGGLCFTFPALNMGHFWLWWLSGVLTSAALVPVVRFGMRGVLAQFAALALALVVVGLVCTMSEGVLFFPAMKVNLEQSLVGGTLQYLLVAAVLVGLARGLRLTDRAERAVEHRRVGWALPMVVLSGLSYVLYYMVFGAIAFQFFTKQYYPDAQETAAGLGIWFWGYQLARGVLMTLAVLPVIYTLRLPRWQAALAVGAAVWIVGGGAALLVPNNMMVAAQRYIHIVEIMTQNVALGITAVLLLRPGKARAHASMHAVPTA